MRLDGLIVRPVDLLGIFPGAGKRQALLFPLIAGMGLRYLLIFRADVIDIGGLLLFGEKCRNDADRT
ncbi:hypothetical protein D3C80_1749830 [compost metagenome]